MVQNLNKFLRFHECVPKGLTNFEYTHCKKYDTTSPILGKQLPIFGTEILDKLSLKQSNNNLGVALPTLVGKTYTLVKFYQELEHCYE